MRVEFQGHMAEVLGAETLLQAFLRQGLDVPHSCKAGSCQRCLLRCTSGQVPPAAARRLPQHLQDKGYLLSCQCHPTTDLVVDLPLADDQLSDCVLLEVRDTQGGFVWLKFETTRELSCHAGQWLQINQDGAPPLHLQISQAQPEICSYEALLRLSPKDTRPAWLSTDAFGVDFQVQGPISAAPSASTGEQPTPEPDPELWAALGDGRTARAVLDDFYAQVYQDPELRPFFHGVTQQRAADKQYAFLRQLMTGEKSYFGDRPRNTHHRMVITDALFDHRQALMVGTLRRHGLDEAEIARWTRFELHYRSDIVKREPWPRLPGSVGDQALDGYVVETLDTAMVCDHCSEAVEVGTQVLYHQRLGTISCPSCAPPRNPHDRADSIPIA